MNYIWADRLRNIATLMVLAIHVAAPVAETYTPDVPSQWWIGNVWNSISRAGVPIFVMLSGFLLLGKDYPLGDFLKRRFVRVLLPALFWMVVFNYYNFHASGDPATIAQALRKIVEGPVHYHLWFIYLILGLYLIYPLIRPWVRQASDQDFWYIFALSAAGAWGYKILYSFWGIGIGLSWEFFTNNFGYFVLGYYLGQKPASDESAPTGNLQPWPWTQAQICRVAWCLILLGSALTAVGAFWLKMQVVGTYPKYFYDYLTPNVGMAAAGWFLLGRHTWGKRPLLAIESDFSTCSFGIYLTHILVLDWLAVCGYWHSKTYALFCIPAVLGATVGLTYIFVMLMRCIPLGQKVT